jgi:hypothetical protein
MVFLFFQLFNYFHPLLLKFPTFLKDLLSLPSFFFEEISFLYFPTSFLLNCKLNLDKYLEVITRNFYLIKSKPIHLLEKYTGYPFYLFYAFFFYPDSNQLYLTSPSNICYSNNSKSPLFLIHQYSPLSDLKPL